jgi:hypothetical protein
MKLRRYFSENLQLDLSNMILHISNITTNSFSATEKKGKVRSSECCRPISVALSGGVYLLTRSVCGTTGSVAHGDAVMLRSV